MTAGPQPASEAVAANRGSISAAFAATLGALLPAALAGALALSPARAGAQPATVPATPTLIPNVPPLATDPPAGPAPYDAAVREYRAGNLDGSLALVDGALRVTPRDPQLRFLRGVILNDRKQPQAAIAVFRSLIDDFPELPEPYNNVAVIHASQGDLDGARRALEEAIRAMPTYALAHENLGDVYLQMAARAYEQARKLDPRSTSASTKLALARDLVARIQAPAEIRNLR